MQDIYGFKYIKKTQQIALYDRKKRGTQKDSSKVFYEY